jgi:hypothetical protein
MNIVQKIRASRLNRHGFIDVTIGLVIFQFIYMTLMFLFCDIDYGDDDTDSTSMGKLIFIGLVIAPYFENLLLIGIAAIHEKLFNRTAMFLMAPALLTALHFITPKPFPLPVYIRVFTLFVYFYIFLKQYDIYKLSLGKHKALLLSSVIHSAINASTFVVASFFEPDIAAETIFSAQPGE